MPDIALLEWHTYLLRRNVECKKILLNTFILHSCFYRQTCYLFFNHIFYFSGCQYRSMTNTEIMNGVKPFANHINIIRANVSHLVRILL